MSVIQTSNQDIIPPANGTRVSNGIAGGAPTPIDLTGAKGGHISIVNGSLDDNLHVRFGIGGADIATADDWFIPPFSSERYRLELNSPYTIVSVFAAVAVPFAIRLS